MSAVRFRPQPPPQNLRKPLILLASVRFAWFVSEWTPIPAIATQNPVFWQPLATGEESTGAHANGVLVLGLPTSLCSVESERMDGFGPVVGPITHSFGVRNNNTVN